MPTRTRSYDLLIRNGTVIDGTGGPSRQDDIAIVGDKIAGVGRLHGASAERVIDAEGRVVAPGFVDAHTHDDRAVLTAAGMTPKVSQGVTSVVTGNCGVSLAPLAGVDPVPPLNLIGSRDDFFGDFFGYFEALADVGSVVNVAAQVGHTALRVLAMDNLDRPATDREIAVMAEALDESMKAGCIGLSTGLAYPPAQAAPTAEVVALVERLAAFNGIHTTHMRNEKDRVVDSVRETIDIGKRAAVPVVISHHKCSGRANWGQTRETLPLIANAQHPVALDVYPYTASSTVLLEAHVQTAERVLVTWSESEPDQAGRDLDDISAEWGCSRSEAVARLLPAGAIYFQMDEADLERIIRTSDAMIGSDGLPHDAVPHPRLWGTFPRVLGRFVRERGWLSLEDAVHRMTGKTAAVFGFAKRGVLAEGNFADLAIFDPDTVIDSATYEAPTTPSAGIETVVVNGEVVWADGAATGLRPGSRLVREPRA